MGLGVRLNGPAAWAWGVLRGVGRAGLDALLPPECLTCDVPVDVPGQLCPACFRKTAFLTEPCCSRCGVGFGAAGQGGGQRVCPRCRERPPSWGAARAALRYDEQGKRIVLPLKYADRVQNAQALAPHMLRAGAALVAAADWLVPVPLHRRRLLARRYNQAALLAQAVARLSGRPALLDGLQRVRVTAPLGEKSPAERAAELAGAFAVRASRQAQLVDSRVLLVDDILTSGATAEACTRVLLAAGVLRVDVLAAARTTDPRLG